MESGHLFNEDIIDLTSFCHCLAVAKKNFCCVHVLCVELGMK